jgi:hypothetical protein
MDGPTTVRLQRRRNELPPDQLFVERRGPEKRKLTGDGPPRGHYVRQKRGTDHSDISSAQSDSRASKLESTESSLPSTEADASVLETRRIFHLRRSSPVVPSSQSAGSRKRKSNSDLATVVEKKLRNVQGDSVATQSHQIDKDVTQTSAPSAPLKRPGRGSAIRPRTNKVDPTKAENENVVARQQRELAALAQEMHQFALDELAKTPKPQIKTKPKLSPARSRALHEQQAPATPSHAAKTKDADDDTAMEDSDGEYVYDTYVLATAPTSLDAQGSGKMHDPDSIANIGYLIIEQDDEQQWEAYIHDLEGSDSEPTDEDDENGMFIPSHPVRSFHSTY